MDYLIFSKFHSLKGDPRVRSARELQSTLQRKSTSVFALCNLGGIFIRRLISLKLSTEVQCLKLSFACKGRKAKIDGLYIVGCLIKHGLILLSASLHLLNFILQQTILHSISM